jgi:hypothetical protein
MFFIQFDEYDKEKQIILASSSSICFKKRRKKKKLSQSSENTIFFENQIKPKNKTFCLSVCVSLYLSQIIFHQKVTQKTVKKVWENCSNPFGGIGSPPKNLNFGKLKLCSSLVQCQTLNEAFSVIFV